MRPCYCTEGHLWYPYCKGLCYATRLYRQPQRRYTTTHLPHLQELLPGHHPCLPLTHVQGIRHVLDDGLQLRQTVLDLLVDTNHHMLCTVTLTHTHNTDTDAHTGTPHHTRTCNHTCTHTSMHTCTHTYAHTHAHSLANQGYTHTRVHYSSPPLFQQYLQLSLPSLLISQPPYSHPPLLISQPPYSHPSLLILSSSHLQYLLNLHFVLTKDNLSFAVVDDVVARL